MSFLSHFLNRETRPDASNQRRSKKLCPYVPFPKKTFNVIPELEEPFGKLALFVFNPTLNNKEKKNFTKQPNLTLPSERILTIQSGYYPLSERAVLVHLLVGRRIEAAAPEGPYSSAASLLAERSA